MTTAQHTVHPADVSKFLTNLFGLAIKATECAPSGSVTFGAHATYVDDDGEVRGHIVCDLPAAAMLGAALTQIPMGAVEDALESACLSDSLRENLIEVLNITVNLFPDHCEHRFVLKEVLFAESAIPEDKIASTHHYEITIQRYGACRLAIQHQ